MKKAIAIIILAVLFVFTFAIPAFAQHLNFTTSYEMDGVINFEKQAGHKCNTGAEIKQTIIGSGSMDKTQSISMIEGQIMMEDDNNWIAGTTPLTVTTVWDLCMPPKFVHGENEDVVPLLDEKGQMLFNPVLMYQSDWSNYDALTDQIYAVQIQADPGFSGNLYQKGMAANGSYATNPGFNINGAINYGNLTYASTSSDWRMLGLANNWVWGVNSYGRPTALTGPDFVGSYFNIEQHGRTSQGTQRRYISLSSPFSHGYLTEDMSVVGRSEIHDTVALNNLAPGSEMPSDWWILF